MKWARNFDNSTNKIEIIIRVRKGHRNFADYFCFIRIFSDKLLICSQTFINLKDIQKLEVLYEFDVRFTPK